MRKRKISTILLILVATVFAYFFLLPLAFMILTSFKTMSESIGSSSLFPKIWTLENYKSLLFKSTEAPMIRWALNTAFVTVAGTCLVVVVDVLAAYSLARLDMPFKEKILVIIVWAMSIPGIVTLYPAFFMYKSLKLTNTFFPLIVPYSANVLGVYLIYNFLKDFPKDLEESAYVDGASLFTILTKVIMPSIKPVVLTLAFLTFLGIYNDYLWPTIAVSSNEMRTLTVGIASLVLGSNFVNPSMMMASTTIAVIPAVVLFIFLNKYIVRGVNNSGLK